MADGASKLGILGTVRIPVRVYNTRFEFEMTVANMDSMDRIWGMDFLAEFRCDFKMSTETFVFNGTEYPMITQKHSILPHSVRLQYETKIAPGSELITKACLNRPFRSKEDVSFEPSVYFIQKSGVLPARSLTTQGRKRRSTVVQLFNATDEEIVIPKDSIVGYAFPGCVSEDTEVESKQIFHASNESPITNDDELLEKLEDNMPQHLSELYHKSSTDLDVPQRIKLASLLIEFQDTFSKSPSDIGKTSLVGDEINTGEAKPFRLPLRRQGFKKEQIIKEAVKDGLAWGIMEESSSPWASAPVIVGKKDGTSRFCIDFRRLNSVTKVDNYPHQSSMTVWIHYMGAHSFVR
ncbi:uncharacterized protein LOC135491611 [Lineus longissimus]|uniref:uncharacterized protein LOC135491611 n=1 Tax=Lineus longissimus TaxID=88925 RepID=UPI00315DE21E